MPWVFANPDLNGYYRTAYDPQTFASVRLITEEKLSPIEREALVRDEWALVQAGKEPIGNFLSLAESLKNDRNGGVIPAYFVESGVPERRQLSQCLST